MFRPLCSQLFHVRVRKDQLCIPFQQQWRGLWAWRTMKIKTLKVPAQGNGKSRNNRKVSHVENRCRVMSCNLMLEVLAVPIVNS